MCRTQSKQKNMAARRVNAMDENSENSDTIYIGELKSVNELDAKETNCVWYEKILVNKNAVTFKLETGSQVNVIPKSELLKWVEKPVVRNCKIAVLDYSDNRVPILEDEDINPYFDDIALGSPTVEEHCRLLRRTLLKARKANLKFNVLKTQLSQTPVNYLGHVLSDEGIKPDPKKIRAIEEFATPNCKEDLQRFLVGICSSKEPSNSRCPISRAQSTTDNSDEVLGQVATVRINLLTQASPTKWEEIASLTTGDPEMQDVLFYINNGKEHLLMIDYLSKYVELKPLNSTTAQSVITVMKSIYATHGIPEELSKWTNRERAVQTVKNSLTKAAEEGKDLYVVLLDYSIQPAKDMPSPAELLMGRKLRTFLPSHPDQLKPTFDVERARGDLRKRQIIQNKYANKHATVLPVLHQNAKVWFKRKMKEPWKQGTIIQVGPQPLSYIIKGEDGGVFRRNRFHIRQDNTENDNPRWSRTVEDLYDSDATEISRIPNDSADSQINASPKTNKSNINQQFQVPIETFSELSNTVVQTGFGRTGKFWGFYGHEVLPDIVTVAKGIGNGFPLAAVITRKDIADCLSDAAMFNTFGGNPVACAIGSAVLDVIDEEKIMENSHHVGTYLLHALSKLRRKYEIIGDVRGKGLMIGVEMVADKESRKPLPKSKMDAILEDTKSMGLLIGRGGLSGNVFRIKPPMCISRADADFCVSCLENAVKNIQHCN
ncbi:alanine--glyoxylate aminotransferase 2, mitochondrial [Trichonephila inaurata madagascariensis]|uniref:Alanine--glyoxylate aminotransferase 2, mitochondrial n=1 Tax=Trichonephila inaurata madagascariensis TaxID=2747483 RepID=A0A8X6YZD4_9ARAC|nr:alanine--glyoxylate aminotransferase 2, mitochondrial [Trichonephila inaurata madagascariensis]